MKLDIPPTRMQLLRLKRRGVIARRGHKLLKDKQDELMRNFLEIVDEIIYLRNGGKANRSKLFESIVYFFFSHV